MGENNTVQDSPMPINIHLEIRRHLAFRRVISSFPLMDALEYYFDQDSQSRN